VPDGFHRIRHLGFLVNGHRTAKLALCRALLAAPTPKPPPAETYRERHRRLTGHDLDVCPDCGGPIRERGPLPSRPPSPGPFWCDSSCRTATRHPSPDRLQNRSRNRLGGAWGGYETNVPNRAYRHHPRRCQPSIGGTSSRSGTPVYPRRPPQGPSAATTRPGAGHTIPIASYWRPAVQFNPASMRSRCEPVAKGGPCDATSQKPPDSLGHGAACRPSWCQCGEWASWQLLLRVAARDRLHQVRKRIQQPRLGGGLRPAPAARAADAAGKLVLAVAQLRKPTPELYCARCPSSPTLPVCHRARQHRPHWQPTADGRWWTPECHPLLCDNPVKLDDLRMRCSSCRSPDASRRSESCCGGRGLQCA